MTCLFRNVVGVLTASIALFTDLEIVLDMISIGTLFVFYLVANALVYRRYVIISKNPPSQVFLFLFFLSFSAIGFSFSWKFKQQLWGLSLFGGSTIFIIAFFNYTLPCLSNSNGWSMPLMPWPPALSIFLNVFLMTTLKVIAFQRFGIWTCFITLFYLLYGVHSTYEADEVDLLGVNINSSILQQNKININQLL